MISASSDTHKHQLTQLNKTNSQPVITLQVFKTKFYNKKFIATE